MHNIKGTTRKSHLSTIYIPFYIRDAHIIHIIYIYIYIHTHMDNGSYYENYIILHYEWPLSRGGFTIHTCSKYNIPKTIIHIIIIYIYIYIIIYIYVVE